MYFIPKRMLAILLLMTLVACQSVSKLGVKEAGFHITDVAVTMPTQTEKSEFLRFTDGFESMMTNTISHHVAEYNATRPNAKKGYALKVDIEKVHFKNPVASLLVGDANRLSGNASLIDPTNGSVIHTMPVKYIDGGSAALNGISGAVLSIIVKKEAAEGTMSKGVAKNLMKLVYPDVKLNDNVSKRLRQKTVYQPMSTALSPLNQAQVSQANSGATE